MKKIILTGFVAALAFAGCSTDEPNGVVVPVTGENSAYMNVRISDAGTRAVDGDATEFEESTTEHNVLTADFYFYDENGQFVTKANIWQGGTTGSYENQNVEFEGDTVVALKGLTDKTLPKYVVTVLNKPASFQYGATLAEMETLLSASDDDDTVSEGGFKLANKDTDGRNLFIMSTSSYKRTGNEKYFVTELTDDNFVKDPGDIDAAKRVTIYVERLAAKVRVQFSVKEGVEGALVPVEGTTDTFKLKMTVAGENNEQLGESNIGSEEIYIKFLGWALNATAPKSYMIKNIDTNWEYEQFNFGFWWSEASRHRSYWGKSYNYGLTETLNYVTGENYTPINEPIYCAENTNTSAVVTADPGKQITSALLYAKITDTEGKDLDLVRYAGVYYKEAHYIAYVFSNLNRQGTLNYYKETVLEDGVSKQYNQISTDEAELVSVGNGLVKVVLKLDAATPLYKKTTDGYKLIEVNADGKTAVEQANATLAAFNAENTAISYRGGQMFYNIPIQHFNNDANAEDGTVPEAKYGIVRNHVYVLDVTSIKQPGMGIFDPEEEIIPEDPFHEDELWQVGANIKILSWKVVNQNVVL